MSKHTTVVNVFSKGHQESPKIKCQLLKKLLQFDKIKFIYVMLKSFIKLLNILSFLKTNDIIGPYL